MEAARRHRDELGWQVLDEYISLLRIPNVTGSVEDLRVNAAELVARFSDREGDMQMIELPGASPVVVGWLRCESPTATLGVYVHYDGQPVDPNEWTTDPFSAALATEVAFAPFRLATEMVTAGVKPSRAAWCT